MKSHKESPVQWIISNLWLILNITIVLPFQKRTWVRNSLPPWICLELSFNDLATKSLGFNIQFLESAIFNSNLSSWSGNYHKKSMLQTRPYFLTQIYGVFCNNSEENIPNFVLWEVLKEEGSWSFPIVWSSTSVPSQFGTFLLNADITYRGEISIFTEWQQFPFCHIWANPFKKKKK